jgi:hypothetical protein
MKIIDAHTHISTSAAQTYNVDETPHDMICELKGMVFQRRCCARWRRRCAKMKKR